VSILSDLFAGSELAVLAGILIFFFVVQALGASWQARRMVSTMKALFQHGTLAVGMAGNIYRGKVYAFLVADDQGAIVKAQQLKGWTVFAQPRPVEALIGLQLSDLLVESPQIQGVSQKAMQAFSMAARTLMDRLEERQAAPRAEADNCIALPN
jgi:DNA-binding transcriptional regulator of glucitol operon